MASPLLFPLLVSLCNFPCQFLPFLNPLLLTWNPSFCVVRSRPPWSQVARKLTSLSPCPPHSKFTSPQGIPSLIVRPTKTTSRSRLHIVRNNNISYKECPDCYKPGGGMNYIDWQPLFMLIRWHSKAEATVPSRRCTVVFLQSPAIFEPLMMGVCTVFYIKGNTNMKEKKTNNLLHQPRSCSFSHSHSSPSHWNCPTQRWAKSLKKLTAMKR